jgi:hypothetical protein
MMRAERHRTPRMVAVLVLKGMFAALNLYGVLTARWAIVWPTLGGLVSCTAIQLLDRYWPERKQSEVAKKLADEE